MKNFDSKILEISILVLNLTRNSNLLSNFVQNKFQIFYCILFKPKLRLKIMFKR